MLLVFVEFAGVIVDSGFPLALIQKKDADQLDFSSVFWGNLVISCCVYLILFFCAKWIARFYNDDNYVYYLRVMSLNLLVSAFTMVHGTFLSRQMKFNLICRAKMLGSFVSGILGCAMAFCGFGVWALIAQFVMCSVITSLGLLKWCEWKPSFIFSWNRLFQLFRYGWKIGVGYLLDTIYKEAYTLVIGKVYSKETLSYYKRGNSFPHLGISTISNTIANVFLPALSSIQDNKKDIRQLLKQGMQTSMFFVTPVMVCLLVMASPLVCCLLTEKWLPCVIFLQLSCLVYLLQPMNDINRQVILALGYSDKILLLEFVLKIQLAVIILCTFRFGVLAMVWGLVLQAPIMFVETAWLNGKLVNYSWWQQLWDIIPILAVNILVAGITFWITTWLSLAILKLTIGCLFFCICYLSLAWYFNLVPTVFRKRILLFFNRGK